MKKLKKTITVVVSDIQVDEEYYSFRYTAKINGKIRKGTYDSDYDGQTARQFEKILQGGYAVELAFEQILDI